MADPFSNSSGINFKSPKRFLPYCAAATALFVKSSAGSSVNSSTTAFHTQMAARGLQDTTDWTGGVKKTLLTVASGSGLVAACVGPTAGGAQNTIWEFIVDGVTSTVTITGLASGERACLLPLNYEQADYTTAAQLSDPKTEALDADKATFGAVDSDGVYILPWRNMWNSPMLEFKNSLTISATHSASITNSTATAYSSIMYRLFLSA